MKVVVVGNIFGKLYIDEKNYAVVEALDTSKTTVEIELFIHEAWLVYIHTATGGGDGQTRWAVNWLA